MKIVDLVAYKRPETGKKTSKDLRQEALVPAVMYGGAEVRHFSIPMALFRDVIYTKEVCFVNMDIEGDEYKCILQDIQFHPVSETILHADFLELSEGKAIKMDIPVKFVGTSPGMQQGGKLVQKLRTIRVKALPQDMPEVVEVDLTGLELGKSVRIKSITPQNYTILNPLAEPIATVTIPRALRQGANN